ncbi:MAG UNVERIFIED_CONTAM: class II fructose-bisphosphatase [Rickettsiaceae bacterium]|jgi:fructose-1,6-bisphosphatase II / sedoheptulose-1,7-bisphosphatase
MQNKDSLKSIILDIADVTIEAAIASYPFCGMRDEMAADQAAVSAMRNKLQVLPISARVVIGEGERDEAPMLYIGEILGKGGLELDIAVDPLEGTSILASGKEGALSVIAVSTKGGLLHAPDLYMDKIAIGFDFDECIIDLDNTVKENLTNVALAKNMAIEDLRTIVLRRERHEELIARVREAGAKVDLIDDGDIAAVISTAFGKADIYMGIGGAPEGVLAASALKTLKGQFCGRLLARNIEEKEKASKLGITDLSNKYYLEDLVKNDVVFAATGITEGPLVKGVEYIPGFFTTETMILYSVDNSFRKIFSRCINQ